MYLENTWDGDDCRTDTTVDQFLKKHPQNRIVYSMFFLVKYKSVTHFHTKAFIQIKPMQNTWNIKIVFMSHSSNHFVLHIGKFIHVPIIFLVSKVAMSPSELWKQGFKDVARQDSSG